MARIHIYQLSRLAYAEVTGWRRTLEEIRRERQYASRGYDPLRKAVVKLLKLPDRESDESVLEEMSQQAINGAWARRNLRAYMTFKRKFAPKLKKCDEVFMGRRGDYPAVPLTEEVEITGGPHFAALHIRGQKRFVYLHPSSRWNKRETDAFCELLCYIVKARFNAEPSDMWFLDLVKGERVSYRPKKTVLRRCQEAADLLFGALDV